MSRVIGSEMAIGIDVGGTECKGVLGNTLGLIGEPLRMRVSAGAGMNQVAAATAEMVKTLIGMADEAGVTVRGVGLVVPGRVDPITGSGEFSANLGWSDVSIGPALEAMSGLPVHVEHDVYAGALAEFTIGAGRGTRSGAFVPVGTGIAAALLIDGRLWRGVSRFAGEIGHISSHLAHESVSHEFREHTSQCGCGRRGCVEFVASARGLERTYARLTGANGRVEAAEIAARVASGERLAMVAWDICLSGLARSLAGLILTVDLATVVIGGGLSESGALLLDPLREKVHNELAPLREAPEIRLGLLGQLAGACGAALHALSIGLITGLQKSSVSCLTAGWQSGLSPQQTVIAASEFLSDSNESNQRDLAMFMLAFDHRSSTAVELFSCEEVSPEQWTILAEAKTVIAEAACIARSEFAGLGDVSVLVDPECGLAAARAACSNGVATALALEVSGRRELQLLDERTLHTAIDSIGAPRWGKVLLRWNPCDPTDLKDANLAALEQARRFCHTTGIEFLLELIVPPTSTDLAKADDADTSLANHGSRQPSQTNKWLRSQARSRYRSEVLPTLLPAAVGEITRRFAPPDLWKLEGVASGVAAAAVSEAACSSGTVPPIVTLGAAAGRAEVASWLAAGARVRGYAGFAIGRSIWKTPIADYLNGRLSRDAARDAIFGRFADFVDDFVVATRVTPVSGSL